MFIMSFFVTAYQNCSGSIDESLKAGTSNRVSSLHSLLRSSYSFSSIMLGNLTANGMTDFGFPALTFDGYKASSNSKLSNIPEDRKREHLLIQGNIKIQCFYMKFVYIFSQDI